MRRRRIAAVAAALLLVTALALGGVAHNDFIVFDDHVYLTGNPEVAGGLSARGLAWALSATRTGNWHPLTWISHMLDVELFGLEPGPHHLVSLAIHAASTLLLFALLRGLTGALWRPALVAALFAVHPLHVESVAWASERKDVLATLLTLLTALAYLGWVRRRGSGRYLATVALFALALAAKPTPVTLPFLLLLLDWWPLGRWPKGILPPARLWLEKAPLLLLSAGSALVTLLAQGGGGAVVRAEAIPPAVRAANALVSYASYLAKTLLPRDLSVFYPHPYFLPPWSQWGPALLLLAAASTLALRFLRRRPWLAVGWLWYLGTLFPMIGIVQVGAQAMADRYTYFSLVGIFLLLAWQADRTFRDPRARALAAVAAGAAILAAAGASAAQVALWRDSVALFRHAVEVAPPPRRDAPPNPSRAMLHNLLGIALAEAGRNPEALVQYREALAVNPHFPDALNNLGRALDDLGRTDEAIPLYRAALASDPFSVEARSNLGAALLARGSHEEAARLLGEAVGLDPEHVTAHNNLALALVSLGRTAEAEAVFRRALALDPRSALGHLNYGRFLLAGGRAAEALGHLHEGIGQQPLLAPAHALLGDALARLGRRAEAREAYRRALALQAGLPEALLGLEQLDRAAGPGH